MTCRATKGLFASPWGTFSSTTTPEAVRISCMGLTVPSTIWNRG